MGGALALGVVIIMLGLVLSAVSSHFDNWRLLLWSAVLGVVGLLVVMGGN